jgi:hypothetical protein
MVMRPPIHDLRKKLLAHSGHYSGGISVGFPVRFRQALSGLVGVVLAGICQNAHAAYL